jgi:hypothetical protein
VLIAGGWDSANQSQTLTSAVIYDPVTGSFTPTGSMATSRVYHTATLLSNGKVLIAGGITTAQHLCLDSAELFDPSANSGIGAFMPTGSMGTFRDSHTATLLPNGKVLLTGGACSGGATAELYDPAAASGAGAFTATGSMGFVRVGHTATLLADGKVLVAGGADTNGPLVAHTSAEIYDPAAGSGAGAFSPTGGMTTGRYGHQAALLPSGAVLVAGGLDATISSLASAEVFDPTAGTFATTGSMAVARSEHTATRLANGQILIAGGLSTGTSFLDSAELFDEAAGTFTATGTMRTTRANHRAALLPNGDVLVAGGSDNGPGLLASAEVYSPRDCGPFNTPAGANISATPIDTATGTTPVTVTFSSVSQAGTTSVTTSVSGPAPPANFQLGTGVYYHIETTATYSAPVMVCINYSGTPLAGTMTQPSFGHYDAATGLWQIITATSWDQMNNVICGTVTSLSPFALLVPFDTTPPSITVSTTPASLWPPNGKMVAVTVRGTINDADSGVDASTAHVAVTDSYGEVSPNGPLSIAADGSYAITIPLPASRTGSDLGGRTYTITVSVSDQAGNAAAMFAIVTVPHDRGR